MGETVAKDGIKARKTKQILKKMETSGRMLVGVTEPPSPTTEEHLQSEDETNLKEEVEDLETVD